MRWTGFAELTFEGNARLAHARALEQAVVDIDLVPSDAFVVEDRHVRFALTMESGPGVLDAIKRLLRALVHQAVAGEVYIEVAQPTERWVLRAGPRAVSQEVPVLDFSDELDAKETIRTEAS